MAPEQELFENNLMPKLIASHKAAKERGETNDYFDLKRIRKHLQDGGFGVKAWEDTELQMKVSGLVKKELIAEVESGYRLTPKGELWNEKIE
jgi:hypothetical protein